ncbi:BnaA04g13520D [Brassica napus]|uniref:RING-type E3 ubiquitin transferase n=1 Tax=Brassica napus TaxID=3708 RepID=A0A078HMU8_BRANA|nr:BnaA04g13520D [Brassica napus]
MEISALVDSISSFLNLSSSRHFDLDPFDKYYKRLEELLRVLKPIADDALLNSDLALEERLCKSFQELTQDVDHSRDLFTSWHPFSSKVYFVLQIESLIPKMRDTIVDTFQFLQSLKHDIPDELSPASLEKCLEKIKHLSYEEISSVIDVALERQKENAEQSENNAEVEFLDQLIVIVNQMHERLLLTKQTQTSSVSILADFFCPLSLEVMNDPVIVSSGQTYEKAFIKRWIDLGLKVCPKTRQTLTHTTLIPNYTVKALISNWCDTNDVNLPDPNQSSSLNELNPLLSCTDSIHDSPSSSNDSPEMNTDENHHHHLRSPSASISSVSNEEFPRTDGNENSEESPHATTPYSSDASGEIRSGPLAATTTSSAAPPWRDLSPRFMDRRNNRGSQFWRRPSKIISAPSNSARRDLAEVESQVKKLLEELKSISLDVERRATAEIRLLAKHNMDNRIVIGNSRAIVSLVELLRSTDSATQENAVTALLNLSINNNNKSLIAEAGAIEPLIHVLENGNSEAKENSAATLFSLSVIEENKIKIDQSGAIGPLREGERCCSSASAFDQQWEVLQYGSSRRCCSSSCRSLAVWYSQSQRKGTGIAQLLQEPKGWKCWARLMDE